MWNALVRAVTLCLVLETSSLLVQATATNETITPVIDTIRYNYLKITWTYSDTKNVTDFVTKLTSENTNTTLNNTIQVGSDCNNLTCSVSYEKLENGTHVFSISARYLSRMEGKVKSMNITMPDIEAPSKPLQVHAQNNEQQPQTFRITWKPPNNTGNQLASEIFYKLKYCNMMECMINSTAKGMLYSYIDVKMSTTYNVTVYAVSLNRDKSTGETVQFDTPAGKVGPEVGSPPTLVMVRYDTIKIKGEATTGILNASIVSYTVELKGNINISEIILSNSSYFTYEFRGLEAKTNYSIRYKVKDVDGESEYSEWKSFQTAGAPSSGPTSFIGTARRNLILLTWDKSQGDRLTKQTLRYQAIDGSMLNVTSMDLNVDKESYIVDNLIENTTYIFNLSVVNAAGESSPVTLKLMTDPNVCPGYDWDHFDGSCYYADDNINLGVNHQTAEMYCEEMTSLLTSIHSDAEQNEIEVEIMRLNSSVESFFIGLNLNRSSNGTSHTWIDESPYSFNKINETDNTTSTCAAIVNNNNNIISNNNKWIIVNCSTLHGYVCKRKAATFDRMDIKVNHITYNMINITLPRTSMRGDRAMIVYVNETRYGSYSSGADVTIGPLNESSLFTVKAQEDFNGLGPWTNELLVTTLAFVLPGAPENITSTSVQYAESRQRRISWAYSHLGDSKTIDVKTHINICWPSMDCKTLNFASSPAILKGLKANTTYTYKIYAFDMKNNKTGITSDCMNFTTAERDNCSSSQWFCEGGTTCISNTSRCDGVRDCPLLTGEKYSVDETTNCSKPSVVNVIETIGGFNFLTITWLPNPSSDRIVEYRILINDTEHNIQNNKPTSFTIVDDILNNTDYELKIFAVNPSGFSPFLTINVTTASFTVPTGPVSSIVDSGVVGAENEEWLITWKLPSVLNKNNPKTLQYKLKWCYNDTENCSMAIIQYKTMHTLTSLSPGKHYTLEIIVLNEFNQSSESKNTSFVTPTCTSGQFKCAATMKCINATSKCDGNVDCKDQSDEKEPASCKNPPPIEFTVDTIRAKSAHISYSANGRVKTLRFAFRLYNSSSPMNLLEEKNVTSTTQNGTIEFNELKPRTMYIVKAIVFNYVGYNETMKNFTTLHSPDECFLCLSKCIPNIKRCDGKIDCEDGSDEKISANCSVPSLVTEITSTAYWNMLIFNWSAPVPQSHVIRYHIQFQCSNDTSLSRNISVASNNTTQTFSDLTTTNTTANCSFSISAENLAGIGDVHMNYYQTATLLPPSKVTSLTQSTDIGREARFVRLSWNDPSNLGNGRSSELTYRVQWCNVADSFCNKTVVSDTNLSLENLKNGTLYDVTVTPINALGVEGTSIKLKFTTRKQDSLPSKPLNVKASDHGDKDIRVSWDRPSNMAGVDESKTIYEVTYCKKSTCKSLLTKPGNTSIIISGLNEDERYTITVRAFGLNGQLGAASDEISHRTQETSLPGYAIALIIIGVMLFVVVVIVIASKWHFKSKYGKASFNENGNQMHDMNRSYNEGYQDDV